MVAWWGWALFFSLLFSWKDVGKEESSSAPQGLSNHFGNKGFDKTGGSEVELVLRGKKRTGDRLSTRTAIEIPDKPLRQQGGRNSMPKTDHRGRGRCWEMQPEVQLGHIPPALPEWQQGGPGPWGAARTTGNPEPIQGKFGPWTRGGLALGSFS